MAVMARVYGFATSDVFAIDIEANHNRFAEFAKSGCANQFSNLCVLLNNIIHIINDPYSWVSSGQAALRGRDET